MKTGDVFSTGNFGAQRWWVLEKLGKRFAYFTELRWSPDLVNEPGVMRRGAEQTRGVVRAGLLYSPAMRRCFDPYSNPVIIKPAAPAPKE